jgi:hypothetical protein
MGVKMIDLDELIAEDVDIANYDGIKRGLYVPLVWLYTVNKIKMWLYKIFNSDGGSYKTCSELDISPTRTRCPRCKCIVTVSGDNNYCDVCNTAICGICGCTDYNTYKPYYAITETVECSRCGWTIQDE